MSNDSGARDDDPATDGDDDAGPDSSRTELLGRQATVTRATSTGPMTRVAAASASAGPGSTAASVSNSSPTASGPITAVREAPRGSLAASAPSEAKQGRPAPGADVPASPDPWSNGGVAATPSIPSTELGAAVVTAVPQANAGAVRKARLTVSQVDPWSVMKMSFLLSLAGGIVLIVAVWILWLLLANGEVFVSIDRTVGDIAGSGSTLSVVELFSLRRVMGIALMLAVVQVVLVTALATLAAFLYNLAAGLVGGFEVTLSEDT